MKKLIMIFLSLTSLTQAHPLLNINVDEDFIYELIQSSKNSQNVILSTKPKPNFYLNIDKYRLKYFSNSLEEPYKYLKPLNHINLSVYYTNADFLLMEGKSGLTLKKGLNAVLIEDGQLSLGKKIVAYYQLRQILNRDEKKGELLRAYVKFILGKISFEVGKDNVNWGVGEYSHILSNNAPPFPMIQLKTERELELFGKWDFSFLHGWLNEERQDVSNPKLLGFRVVYKPSRYFEIGGSKTTLYGGDGRPGYKLTEYWELITSTRDNIPGDKYDNDSRASFDISVYLPLEKYFDVFKLYYEQAGSDIIAFWQKGVSRWYGVKFPYIFEFNVRAYTYGFFISKKNQSFRFEYIQVPTGFYTHHWYPYDGYTYKGYSLGYPYGPNVEAYFVKYTISFNKENHMKLTASYYKQPWEFSIEKYKNFFISLEYYRFISSKFQITPYIRYDYKEAIDTNLLATQFDFQKEEKHYITLGLSVSLRF